MAPLSIDLFFTYKKKKKKKTKFVKEFHLEENQWSLTIENCKVCEEKLKCVFCLIGK